MSYQKPLIERFKANVDLSGSKYCQVALVTDKNTVGLPSADGIALGILQNAPKAGEDAEVAIAGGALLKLIGTVTLGSPVGTDAAGKGKAPVNLKHCIGFAKEAGVAGDVIEVMIDRMYFNT